jgi:hypothetical protein
MAKYLLVVGVCLMLAVAAGAQDDTKVTVETISYDQTVTDTINNDAPYDWWQLQAQQGDVIVVNMSASDGLAPLLGILDPGGDLVASTLDNPAELNSSLELEYTAQVNGIHTLVASRVGRLEGTTSGSYALLVRRGNPSVNVDENYQDVVFRCQDFEAATVTTVIFGDDVAQADTYRISVYGLDGLQPVIRVHLSEPDITDCSQDGHAMPGDEYTLPGEETRTLTEPVTTASQLTIKSADQMGTVTLTIGSRDSQPGRYMAVIQGLQIAPRTDRDTVDLRLGPLAKDTTLSVYMIGDEKTRLDPVMRWLSIDGEGDVLCDDAGRRDCEAIPTLTGVGVRFNDNVNVIGDSFDAGLHLAPGNLDPMTLELNSREGDTQGGYSLVLIGELPPH